MSADSPEKAVCQLCGEPMPKGEEMFKYHGYSGPCPKPPKPVSPSPILVLRQALTVIAEALKEPAGGSYWPARGFLGRYDKFHDDLDGDRVLLRVAEVALEVTKNARVMG